MNTRSVVVLNYGGQLDLLMIRRIRDFSVFSEIFPIDIPAEKLKKLEPIGIILTGSELFHPENGFPLPDRDIYQLGIPILAAGTGAQIMAHQLGGKVKFSESPEPSSEEIRIDPGCPLFVNLEPVQKVWFDGGAEITRLPQGFQDAAEADARGHAAFAKPDDRLFAALFSLDYAKTNPARRILDRFLFQICGADGSFTLDAYLKSQIKSIRKAVEKEKIILGLSGGVSSAVVAAILSAAVPKQLTCVLVDHGMLREGEGDAIEETFRGKSLNMVRVDASERFYKKLSGVCDPVKKRKIIDEQFYKVFAKQAERIGGVKILALGTVYPDLIQGGIDKQNAARSRQTIRELSKDAGFKELVEPLRYLFKDDARKLGQTIGLPEEIVSRPPFPASGLALRIHGEVTRGKVGLLRAADAILTRELVKAGLKADRVYAVLTDLAAIEPETIETGRFALVLRETRTDDPAERNGRIPFPAETGRRIAQIILKEADAIKRVVWDFSGDG